MSYDYLIERHIAQARELRARYHAHLMRQAWVAIRRFAGRLRARAPRHVTHAP